MALNAGGLALVVGLTSIAYGSLDMARPSLSEISLGVAELPPATSGPGSQYVYQRLQTPDRTAIYTSDGTLVATMTDGARTGHIIGPPRTFEEPRFTKAKVHTDVYVHLAPKVWRAGAEQEQWFVDWLEKTRTEKPRDVLETAFQYTYGASPEKDSSGQQIAGDAAFGPLSDTDPDGRAENSDFYDYLGVSWTFPDKREKPAAAHILSLDCSGFVRMVYGYRMGFPLLGTNTKGPGLPRRAYAIAAFGPGVQLMENRGTRPRELDRLFPGDMLFFNAGPVQGANIEHMGIYLGVDDRGHHRFISSRSQANGPTMGDLAGESILDGTGYWALRMRTARRV
ncbi:hypothetical protein GCM10009779_61570 [Polymorphospora rubra]|uniref:NlpC/P60 domain-containing protein n=2 Tax=Polymorphospora rubra TaxID=338584 RepID=A0A810MWG7_9ACTN|nr:hypothetical protein Prubr_19210 [Polymorphospora rubra]